MSFDPSANAHQSDVGAANSVVDIWPGPVTAGNGMLALVWTPSVVPTVVDTLNLRVWDTLGSELVNFGGRHFNRFWLGGSNAGTPHVTVTYTGDPYAVIFFCETPPNYDQTAQHTYDNGVLDSVTDILTGFTSTLANADSFAVASMMSTASGSPAVGSGFTQLLPINSGIFYSGYLNTVATTAMRGGFTQSSPGGPWIIALDIFYGAGGGSPLILPPEIIGLSSLIGLH